MKIKMLASIAGDDFALSPGEETDRFSKAEAIRLIEGGHAVLVIEHRVEKSVKKPAPETR